MPSISLLRVGALTIRRLGGNPIMIGTHKKEEAPLQYALDALKEIKGHRIMQSHLKSELLWSPRNLKQTGLKK